MACYKTICEHKLDAVVGLLALSVRSLYTKARVFLKQWLLSKIHNFCHCTACLV